MLYVYTAIAAVLTGLQLSDVPTFSCLSVNAVPNPKYIDPAQPSALDVFALVIAFPVP